MRTVLMVLVVVMAACDPVSNPVLEDCETMAAVWCDRLVACDVVAEDGAAFPLWTRSMCEATWTGNCSSGVLPTGMRSAACLDQLDGLDCAELDMGGAFSGVRADFPADECRAE